MKIVTAPAPLPEKADLFLAGGISNCPLWQDNMISLLSKVPGTALNPRRSIAFKEEDAVEQIEWEFEAFKRVKNVLFWFPEETLCPITLLELGKLSVQPEYRLFVGTHPNYGRKLDVLTQLRLERPGFKVVHSLTDLANQVKNHFIGF